MEYQINSLRDHPHFADVIAHRGWHAWWTESGVPLADYRAHLDPMITGQGIPFALVAHQGEIYIGSCLVIESDLEARPHLKPWIAALWVDPDHRRKGIATALMQNARNHIHAFGINKAYLCAEPKVTAYYLARGWQQIEADISGLNVLEISTP
jgi:GNAT superfamily N-acetyltransferase